ncbi:Helix-turn-helix [Mycolicibacterium fluoranthenivorans]|uniref:Helix-turn-helix n=2 Tax=Mycolicibacterium fluoranthenivorans TaxID=258505 RepID=A0A1G4X2N7_9MYCO|nr:Helix-turn-helix [Mycolicibacterium fluoranthenivorans]
MARQGFTQTTLAERINRDQHFISRRLSGKVAFAIDELAAIAEALDVPLAGLLGDKAAEASA